MSCDEEMRALVPCGRRYEAHRMLARACAHLSNQLWPDLPLWAVRGVRDARLQCSKAILALLQEDLAAEFAFDMEDAPLMGFSLDHVYARFSASEKAFAVQSVIARRVCGQGAGQ